MANGAFNFKNNSGNIVSFISGSDSNIIMSGGTLDLSGMSGLTLGNLTMEGTVETASFAPSYLLTSSFNTYSGTTNTVIGTLQTSTGSLNTFTSSTTSRLSSIETSTSSLNTFTSSATTKLSSIEGVTGSYATTGSNIFRSSQTITGSLFVSENLVIAGSSSIQYISSSVVNIANNIITVNALNPSLRFGGLAVIDSGSSPQVSGSMLFDSVNNQWIFVHQNQSTVTSSVLLMGPETYDNLGNESYLTLNRLPKGTGIEHLVNSNITDTGTKVSINSNTEVTGSLITTGAGTFSGNVGINGSPGTSFPLEAYINSSTTYTTSSRGNVFRVYNTNTSANVFAGIELGGAGTANDGLAGINGVVTGSGNGALTFYTRNSNTFLEKMRINSDGNVGIGTTSPTNSRLLIAGTHVSGNSILGVVPISNQIASIGLYNSSAVRRALFYSDSGVVRLESDLDPLQIFVQGNNGIVVQTNGDVGIGITSPFSKLHVRNSTNTLEGTMAIGHETFPGLIYSSAQSGEFRIDNRSSASVGYISFYPNGQNTTLGNQTMKITRGGVEITAPNTVTGTLLVQGGKNDVTSTGEINSRIDFGSNDASVGETDGIKSGGRIASVTEFSNGAFTGMAFSTYQQGRSPALREAMRIYNDSSVGVFGNLTANNFTSSGFVKSHNTTKTFNVQTTLNERLSNANYFRVQSTLGGGFQVVVYTFSQSTGIGWFGSQIFQATTIPFFGGWSGSSANVSQLGGESGVISSAVIGNDGSITFRVNTGNNGTNTQSTINSFIQVSAFQIDGISVTLL